MPEMLEDEPRFEVAGPGYQFHLELDLPPVGEAAPQRVRFEDARDVVFQGGWGDWLEREPYTLVGEDVRGRQMEIVKWLVHDEARAFLSLGCKRVLQLPAAAEVPALGDAASADRLGAPGEPLSLPHGDAPMALADSFASRLTLIRRGGALDLDAVFREDGEVAGGRALRFTDVRDGRFTSEVLGVMAAPQRLGAHRCPAADGGEDRIHVYDFEQDGILEFTCREILPLPLSPPPGQP